VLGNERRLPAVFGAIHASVDAACAMAVLSAVVLHRLAPWHAFYLVVGYNVLAFAGQAPLGAATDKLRAPRGAALLGLLLTVAATLALPVEPVATMIFAGVGNALFHVGAGAITLRLNPERATAPGIFVAPGALGLALGVWLGRGGWSLTWPFTVALAVGFVVTALITVPPGTYRAAERRADRDERPPAVPWPKLVVGLLLLSVAVRSLLGFAGAYAVPKEPVVLFALATAAFGGKALGGIVSDRLGWIETSVGALLLSAPLLAWGGTNAAVVVVGMFLFQMTMPVTLSAIGLVHPDRPGFAFGVACLALILGALPTFTATVRSYYGWAPFLVLVLVSATSVYAGLRLLGSRNPVRGWLSRRGAR
jgi:FSR family fosmidomycin resistance protein-like MFS transporter